VKERPYFAVGERVMIFSESHPELNGEDEVYEIIHNINQTHDRVTGETVTLTRKDGKFAYKLKNTVTASVNANGERCEGVWSQSALRKIHTPATESFEEMMKSLMTCE
jgi:hypothetical protein